jgi:VanZ family protein
VPRLGFFLKYGLPLLLWMAVIFSASSDRQSFEHSSRIIGPFLHWLFPGLGPEQLDRWVFFCRKIAHLTEYGLLAMLAWRAFRHAGDPGRFWNRRPALAALALVFLYAISDEVHQAFVPSRQGAVVDVLIDTLGGAAGLGLIWLGQRLREGMWGAEDEGEREAG